VNGAHHLLQTPYDHHISGAQLARLKAVLPQRVKQQPVAVSARRLVPTVTVSR
jgi:hypothetical protein